MITHPTISYIATFIFLIISTSYTFASSGRYPTDNAVDSKTTSECQCDADKDPCCIPPVGKSSTKIDKAKDKTTDVSQCKCDPKLDPCCKKIEGTK
jgi:hypothetical protein